MLVYIYIANAVRGDAKEIAAEYLSATGTKLAISADIFVLTREGLPLLLQTDILSTSHSSLCRLFAFSLFRVSGRQFILRKSLVSFFFFFFYRNLTSPRLMPRWRYTRTDTSVKCIGVYIARVAKKVYCANIVNARAIFILKLARDSEMYWTSFTIFHRDRFFLAANVASVSGDRR